MVGERTRVGLVNGKDRGLRAGDSSTASGATRHQSADLAAPAGPERNQHRATHDVLRVAFGWEDMHLHRFEIRGRETPLSITKHH
jgi:hypothetical protein